MADFDTDHPVAAMINLRGKLYPGMGIILGGPLTNIILEEEDVFRNSKYVNLTTQRALNTKYTNDTGRTIMVNVSLDDTKGSNPTVRVVVDDVEIIKDNYDNGGNRGTTVLNVIVPPGQTYAVNVTGANPTIQSWSELRPDPALIKPDKWVNLTTTREFGVDYTNTTGKVIQVAVTSANGSSGFSAFVDDVRVATSYSNYNTANPKHSIIIDVPPGSKYKFTGGTKDNWAELRPA